MAKLKGDELLQSVQVAINSSIVPPGRYEELHPSIDIVCGTQKMVEIVVKLGEFLIVVLVVEHHLRVGQLAGVRQGLYVLVAPGENEEGD